MIIENRDLVNLLLGKCFIREEQDRWQRENIEVNPWPSRWTIKSSYTTQARMPFLKTTSPLNPCVKTPSSLRRTNVALNSLAEKFSFLGLLLNKSLLVLIWSKPTYHLNTFLVLQHFQWLNLGFLIWAVPSCFMYKAEGLLLLSPKFLTQGLDR